MLAELHFLLHNEKILLMNIFGTNVDTECMSAMFRDNLFLLFSKMQFVVMLSHQQHLVKGFGKDDLKQETQCVY